MLCPEPGIRDHRSGRGKNVYTYDRAGHISSIMNLAGNLRTFIYNEAGELTEETNIRGNIARYEYNYLDR